MYDRAQGPRTRRSHWPQLRRARLPQLTSNGALLGPAQYERSLEVSTRLPFPAGFSWFDTRPFPVFLPAAARVDDQPENRADNSDGN